MRAIAYILASLLMTIWLGCTPNAKDLKFTDREKVLRTFKDTMDRQRDNPDLKMRLEYWKKQAGNKNFKNDSVLLSKINYNIAGQYYGLGEIDSVKKHMQTAWSLMENCPGYEEEKVLLYSGLGNIASMEQKIHQENYYYNHAAQMILADTSLKLSPKQKITIFFSTAQSSVKLRQFENAYKLNRKAINLLPQLANNTKDRFRAYSQMADYFFNVKGSLDSHYHYIKKMELVNIEQPDLYKVRYIIDRKATYFERTLQLDSALFYNRKRISMDMADLKQNGKRAESVSSGNMYIGFFDIAGLFIQYNQLDSAKYYLKQCEKFQKDYPQHVDDESKILYQQNLINYLFATKQYATAETEQANLIRLTRKVYETENTRAVAEMSAIFELKAKDKSIHNLSETVALAQSRLQSNRLWLAVSALATLLAIAMALLLYFIQQQRKLQTETEKAQLEQRLLRTQMEPHFIFNTLSALQSFVRFDEKEKTLKYLHQFGRLLRSSLELSRESFVPLSEEIAALDNYLSLQQMRYDDAFGYEVDQLEDIDTAGIYIPPMLMQPFVENAIIHGINPNGKNGLISVNFEFKDKQLLVKINDNGTGLSRDHGQSHKSLSTTISRERLNILSKELAAPAGIEISSNPAGGTEVRITIPTKTSGKNE
ncbi:sensor histidine kinase [Pedobacter rhizosphaerae]|uniref:Histidine kinase n=1 Tax=Pedobacter rhizosphaerae TaxID=390241 RepID=A0A1H9IP90_9SPHI|nr:histidine kinase [Pedobacter rhizosphaerae]SEQ76366.1 Histidine kinase [Pedobacter rhizosphaerae]